MIEISSTEQEITLADSFHLPVDTESISHEQVEVSAPQKPEMVAPVNLSLPAAFCDDLLIEEISAIPSKMGFKIGEVADMLDVKQYVLRYWESEFDVLNPKKAANNQRYYTRKDVENAYIIRKLLHRDRFSIEGARAALNGLKTFVKTEVKKEKEWSLLSHRLEVVQNDIDELLIDIRKLKQYLS